MSKPRGLIRRLDDSGVPLLLARLAVGGMFAYTAIMKLRDPIEFLKQTREYHVLPTDPPLWLNLTAVAVPWLELICAVALLVGFWRRGAALVINGMLLFFTPMLAIRAWHLLHDPASGFTSYCAVIFQCGCGTPPTYICRKLAENIALQAGALIALFSASQRFCLSAWLVRRPRAALQPEMAKT